MTEYQSSELKISVISDITLEPNFSASLELLFDNNVKVFSIPYGEQNEEEYQKQLLQSDIIVIWLNFETEILDLYIAAYSHTMTEQQIINEIVSRCSSLYAELQIYENAVVSWLLFEDYFYKISAVLGCIYEKLVDKINIQISETLSNNISFIDLKRLIAQIGITCAYNTRGKYRWCATYSKQLIESAAREIHKRYLIENGTTKKCLVLDCDNVIWGGILSEDGIENINLSKRGLGRPYQDFQKFILSLYYHGVILAICSKNDFSDVETVFSEHSEMILKMEHISCFKVNWENKAANIKLIAETLNIALDSIVFIDDSITEIHAVKTILPEVVSILYDHESIYDKLSCFNIKCDVDIKGIMKRSDTYRTNQFRKELEEQYENYDEYITSLDIKLDIHRAKPIEFARMAEITQRTNKCTNGKRYTVADIKVRIKNAISDFYTVGVSDRFSDLGLVGVVEVENNIVTLFSLSCRALGRNIENSMADFILRNHQVDKFEFYSTGKNEEFKRKLQAYFEESK